MYLSSKIKAGVIALVDQSWLSLISLLTGLVYVKLGSKGDYGLYLQAFSAFLLLVALQSALLLSPALSTAPRLTTAHKIAYFKTLSRLQFRLATLFVCVLGAVSVLLVALGASTESVFYLAIGFALIVMGRWSRELFRTQQFVGLSHGRVLRVDLLYGALALSFVYTLARTRGLDAGLVLGVIGIANMVSVAIPILASAKAKVGRDSADIAPPGAVWSAGKWSLMSTILNWTSSNGYVYVASTLAGLSAVAELGASRLLVAPLPVLYLAWTTVFRPSASRWIASREWRKLTVALRMSIAGLLVCVAAYSLLLLTTYEYLATTLLTEKYADVSGLVTLWVVYVACTGINTVATSTLLADSRFRELSRYSGIQCITTVACVLVGIAIFGAKGAIAGLIAGELSLMAAIWGVAIPRLHQHIRDAK